MDISNKHSFKSVKSINESNFIDQLKNGNEAALDYVVDNYAYILVGIINKHLFYLQDRKDECLNDCLLAIWQNIDSYDPKKSSFKNWIGGIGRFKSIDYIRKYLRDLDMENIEDKPISTGQDGLDLLLEKEFNEQVHKLLSNLSEEDQEIFIEIYFKNLSADQVSKNLNLEKSLIYNRLSRGRKHLKLLWGGKANG